MKTEELIATLANESVPVKRVARPTVSFLRWLLVGVFCLFAGLAIFGLREDHAIAWSNPKVLLELLVIASMVVLSASSAFVLSIPDKKNRLAELLPIVTLALWLGILVSRFLSSESLSPGRGLRCIAEVIALGLLPAAFLFFLVKASMPLQPKRVVFFAMLASLGLGAFGTQLSCYNNDALHALLYHFLPVGILGAIGVLCAHRILK